MTNDELRALCESNARAIAANSEQMAENDAAATRKLNNLADIVQAFIAKLDSDGLKVTLITDVVDDVAAETGEVERTVNNHSAAITSLIESANADRKTFKEEMQAAREESARRFDAQLSEIQAQGEQIRALLSALATTNSRVDNLEQAS